VSARIYTRSGDKGETSLADGARVPKDSIRVEAYGSVDELNSVLGLARSFLNDNELDSLIQELQADLLVVGADLASIQDDSRTVRISGERVQELEKIIDKYQDQLPPLKVFILPTGSSASAAIHFARSVSRRAERRIVTLSKTEPINPQMIPYINRLADLLFVLARVVNQRAEKPETEWHSQRIQRT
jgi:cob(I)alamin adenosyltransferase